ncbi:MAG: PAS domain S-box protein, partial [bacterium]|nr:PAS domain S-box protein [bacterium]
ALIDELTLTTTGETLLPAINEGIIVPLSDQYRLVHLQEQDREELDFGVSYKFQHDRVQQAAYALLTDEEKTALHLKIARLLQAHTPAEHLEERLIEIVRHFNEGRGLIVAEQERKNLSLLNIQASKKAKKSNAYRPAFEYAKIAKVLLPNNAWRTAYDHCFEVHQEYAETAFLSGELEIASEIIQLLLDEAKTTLEKARIYQMQVRQYVISGENETAVQTGLQALSLLGIKLSLKPGTLSVLKEIALTKWNLGRRSVESLIDMPLMDDIEKQIAMRVMIELAHPAYMLGYENLLAVLAFKQTNYALRFGNSPEAAYSYIVYALLLNGALGDLRASYEFGKLALRLNEKLGDLEFRCRINVTHTTVVHSWNHHWKTTFPFYKNAIEAGLQSGDLFFIGYAGYLMPKLNTSLSLEESCKLGEQNLQIVSASKYQDSLDVVTALQQYRFNLMGKTKDRSTLSDSVFDEGEFLTIMRQRGFVMGAAWLLNAKLELSYLYEDFDEAMKLIPEIDEVVQTLLAVPAFMEYFFYSFMTHAAARPEMNKKAQRRALRRMKKEYKQMRKWHDHYSVNSYHFVYMMEAEFAQIKNDRQAAIACLKKAIEAATENDFLQFKALANKLLGKLYLSLNEKRVASLYLTDAYYDYHVWGASRMLEFLTERYETYIDQGALQRQSGSHQTQTLSGTSGSQSDTGETGAIDLGAVTKAAQAISGEVVLDKLLTKLMQTVRENAGAEKALLLLAQGPDNELLIQAQSLAENTIEVMLAKKPEESGQLSLGIVNYVARSLEQVVLGDAFLEKSFASDPYIQTQQPKSVLGMPVLNQGNLVGLLYLENNVAAYAFTPDRLEVLQILASQAAIALENARLHTDLQASEKKYRTLFEDSKDVIFISSLDGQIVDVNPACETLLGYTPQEALQLHAPTVYAHPADRVHFQKAIAQYGAVQDFEVTLRHKDGHDIEAVISATPRQAEDGAILGYQGIMRDITAQKEADAERLRALELQKAKEAAELANRAKSDFLSSMSHELRTPLNAILGYAHILKRRVAHRGPLIEGLDVISQSGAHLLTLITDVLDLAKIEAGKLELHPAPVTLPTFLRQVTGIMRARAEAKELSLTYEALSPLPATVLTDETRLRQVLLNLLGNAVKFTDRGHVALTVAIIDEAETEGGEPQVTLRCQVEDTGVGIAPGQSERIFRAFEQVGEAGKRAKGTGLGLALSQEILSMMGSRLQVKSTPGHGSTFWCDVVLPVAAADERERLAPAHNITGYEGAPRRVLVADDKPYNRLMLRDILEPLGFEVSAAGDGQQALDRAREAHPDVILMDLVMPVKTGFVATQELRQR